VAEHLFIDVKGKEQRQRRSDDKPREIHDKGVFPCVGKFLAAEHPENLRQIFQPAPAEGAAHPVVFLESQQYGIEVDA